MMKCSKCNKELFGESVKRKGALGSVAATAAIIFGGPFAMAIGALHLGIRAFEKHVMKEVEIKCPHCKAKLTLTKDEFKTLKEEMYRLQEEERKSKQNRVVK